jgi:DNA-binding Lrp family transcriptional regulator
MTTQKEAILKVLSKEGRKSPGLTTAQVAAKAKVPYENVSKRVYDLRNEGHDIDTHERTLKNGSRVFSYQLYA